MNFKDLNELVNQSKESLHKHPNKELILPMRKQIYAAMGDSSLTSQNRAEITNGLIRRTWLEILSTKHVISIWERNLEGRDPHRMISLASDYLRGQLDWMEAWHQQNNFGGGLSNFDTFPSGSLHASYVGHASVSCVLTALKDSYMEDDGMLDEMLDSWDGSFYASAAYSHEMPWEDISDSKLRFEFWMWWLDYAVPHAAQKVKEE
jgi:hypothetical protein